jgi:hypothetical protein
VQSDRRLLRLQELIQEAESLGREESRSQHHDRRLTRLAAVLWVCRDVVDEIVEVTIIKPDPPEGRPEREHL